jgi:hypothetical protein
MSEGERPIPMSNMELRDWFAGQALVGVITAATICAATKQPMPEGDVAAQCYTVADAMLEEREK